MNNIALGKYIPGNSFIHKLDPRFKIIMMILLMVAVFLKIGYIGFALLFIVLFALFKIARLQFKMVFKTLKPMLFMMLFLLVLNILVMDGKTFLFTIPGINFDIYLEPILQTLFIVIRMILMISVTTLLTSTTKPLDLTFGIESLLSPLKIVRFPYHEVAMIITLALRFIPTIMEETQKIIKAQASRGVDLQEGKLREKISAVISLLVPLLLSQIQRAGELSDAMEARGYDTSKKRTRYRKLHITYRDFVGSFICIVILVGSIFLGKFENDIFLSIKNLISRVF